MHAKTPVGLLVLAGLLVFAPPRGAASSETPPASGWRELAGQWRLDTPHSDQPDSAIDRGARSIFFLARHMAKNRLHKYLDPAPSFELRTDSDTLRLLWRTHHYFILPDRGRFKISDPDEGAVTCDDTWSAPALDNLRQAGDGSLRRRMVLESGGKALELSLTIESSRLDSPVVVRYRYERVVGEPAGHGTASHSDP